MLTFTQYLAEANAEKSAPEKISRFEVKLGTSRLHSRLWYHPKTEKVILVPIGSNHSQLVAEFPESFDLTDDEIPSDRRIRDYDDELLHTVMEKGWVRVMVDIRFPEANSNLEATSHFGLRKAAQWYLDTFPNFRMLVISLRTGHTGDVPDRAKFKTLDQSDIERFIKSSTWTTKS